MLATEARRARRPLERMQGLLGTPPLAAGRALIIEPAAQVHTIGLRYPIDVLFCDRSDRVVHIVRSMRPWRFSKWARRARYVVEFPAGIVPDWLEPGMQISIVSGGSRLDP